MLAKLFSCEGEVWKCKNDLRTSSTTTPSVSVAALPKEQGYGRSFAGTAGFESHRGYGCLSLVSVVRCHVEVFA